MGQLRAPFLMEHKTLLDRMCLIYWAFLMQKELKDLFGTLFAESVRNAE